MQGLVMAAMCESATMILVTMLPTLPALASLRLVVMLVVACSSYVDSTTWSLYGCTCVSVGCWN